MDSLRNANVSKNRWALFFLLALVESPGYVIASVVHVKRDNGFCHMKNSENMNCNFGKTNLTVELAGMDRGVKQIRVEAATTFRGRPPCGTNLEIWSSSNVTLLGSNVEVDIASASPTQRPPSLPSGGGGDTRSGRHRNGNRETVNEGIAIGFPGQPSGTSNQTDLTRQPNRGFKIPPPTSKDAGGVECIGNASVHQSRIHKLQGDFGLVSVFASEVRNIDGVFKNLLVKRRSEISELSVTADNVNIEGTIILKVLQLKVLNGLQLRQISLKQLADPGMTLLQLTVNRTVDLPVHEMSHMNIGSIKLGKIVISGSHLIMNNVSINETGTGSISIEAGGKATLNNVSIRQGPNLCLVLRGNSRVVLNNFTINGNTIDHLDTSIEKSKWPVYPLLSQKFPEKTSLKIRPHQRATKSKNSDDGADDDVDADKGFIGMPWYWLPVMTLVGLVSGMVVGVAMGCGGSKGKPGDLSSSLTFSDLMARETHDEDNRCMNNGVVGPQRPDFVRQDSGLTSSSFASYTACADRRLSAAKHMEDFDQGLIATADPNLFIHVPTLSCTHEDVIYEEVEAFPTTREENTYVQMQ